MINKSDVVEMTLELEQPMKVPVGVMKVKDWLKWKKEQDILGVLFQNGSINMMNNDFLKSVGIPSRYFGIYGGQKID